MLLAVVVSFRPMLRPLTVMESDVAAERAPAGGYEGKGELQGCTNIRKAAARGPSHHVRVCLSDLLVALTAPLPAGHVWSDTNQQPLAPTTS